MQPGLRKSLQFSFVHVTDIKIKYKFITTFITNKFVTNIKRNTNLLLINATIIIQQGAPKERRTWSQKTALLSLRTTRNSYTYFLTFGLFAWPQSESRRIFNL